jgi:tetratricopeptide (TPR) repeat protein
MSRWQLGAAMLAITVAGIALYWHTLPYGYTDLDDLIFIREREAFNRDAANLWRAFGRGVFVDSGDTYYRPLLLWTFVADRHREGRLSTMLHTEGSPRDSLVVYRTTNIVLHVIGSVLVFLLLRRLLRHDGWAWMLAMVFVVHPALVQAVVWIPGRNDSMLAIATFSYALAVIAWINRQRWWVLAKQFLLLLVAMLTKETALIVGPAVLGALALWRWNGTATLRLLLLPLGMWIASSIVWALLRAHATVEPLPNDPVELAQILWERLPLYLQYLGKSIVPVELSVFPRMEDTSFVPGIIAIVLLGSLLWSTRAHWSWRQIVASGLWYVLFLLPALVVPRFINQEAYEHRLYVPIVGILWLVGSATIWLRSRLVPWVWGCLLVVFAIRAWDRTESFQNRIVFWEEAVRTSPHSAYARMMLGARYYLDPVNPRKPDGERLLWEAYGMDSTQKYINYYIGNLYWDRGELNRAKPHYQRELAKIPGWPELYFRLARIAFDEGKLDSARILLERCVALAPNDPQANHNLLLLYLDTGRLEDARRQVARMQSRGLAVPPAALERMRQSAAGN